MKTQLVDHRDFNLNVTAPWHLVDAVDGLTRLLVDLAFIRTCTLFAQSLDQSTEPFPDWSIRRAFRLLDVNHFLQYIHSTSISLYQRQVLNHAKPTTTYSFASRVCSTTSTTLFLGRNHPLLDLFYALQFPFFIQVWLSVPPNGSYSHQFCDDEVLKIRVTSFRHIPP